MKTALGIILLVFSATLSAQEKVEFEQRVNTREVPVTALDWLNDAYEKARRIKWYYEETSGLTSYEAKLKWKGHLHSVEFDTSGIVQDIEISIEWQELPEQTRQNITSYLDSAFSKYRVQKLQEQWTGAPDDLEDLIDEEERDALTTRYEIEYYGKNEAHDSLWEGLFDSEGIMLNQRKVKLRPTDNLNF